jgi:eukaryotic-like serine/threonine-protein kinase
MAAGAKRCPSCGAVQPANASEGVCPRCGMRQVTTEPPPPRAPATGPSPPEAKTRRPDAHTEGRVAGAASARTEATGSRTPGSGDPVRTVDDGRAAPDLARGSTVRYFGDYEIHKELGRGGMGVVYKARQVKLNRPVALKMIKAGVLADPDDLRRFQNEAEAVALLDHPGIVPIYEVGEHDGQRYFSMKLIEGGNLADQLASFQDNPNASVSLMIDTAEAVQHAHIRGILHRDLKPANILIDRKGHPHITDFGLAKRIESDAELTASGAIMGTPAYMSPEQTGGLRGTITTATDVYGLGAILYALLAGKAPFGGESVIQTLAAVLTNLPEPPTKRNAKVPRDLELICLKCLEKNPVDRYPTAQALVDDLRRFAVGEPVSVRAAGAVERAAKWARRKPTLAAAYALGSLSLLFGGLGGAAVWQWSAAARARDAAAAAKAAAEQARDGEKTTRAAAEKARDGEAKARDVAEQLGEKVARLEYGRSMEVAHQEWRMNNIAAALTLLEGARPDLRGWEWRYVQRLCHFDLLTLQGHAAQVASASFSPDGSRVVTASGDSTVKVWDARSGAIVLTLKGHSAQVTSASFSPNGSRIITASNDKTAKVWDAKSGALALTLMGHTAPVTSASFSPDGSRVVTGSVDQTAKVWDARSGAETVTLEGHSAHVSSVSFSPDGLRIVTGSWDNTAKVWDAKSGALALTLKGHTYHVLSTSFSPDGSRVVTGSRDNTAKVWDARRTGTEDLTLKGHTGPVFSASFSPDGARLVTSSGDSTAKVWGSRNDTEALTLKGHTGPVFSASFSQDGARLVTGSWDKTAKVWDAKSGDLALTLKGHADQVTSASFSSDGARVVTGSWDNTAKVWEARGGDLALTLKGHSARVTSASFSPDGSRIATASDDGTAKVWDAKSGALVLTLKGHTAQVYSASFSPDGARVATGSPDGTAKVWDAKTGAEVLTLKGHTGPVFTASFSPDGARVVTGSDDMTAKVWDAKTGAEVLTLKGHTNWIASASFSPDGTRIVTASWDKTAKVWDTAPFKASAQAIANWLPAEQNDEDQHAGNAEGNETRTRRVSPFFFRNSTQFDGLRIGYPWAPFSTASWRHAEPLALGLAGVVCANSCSVAAGRGIAWWQDIDDRDPPDFLAVDDDRHRLPRFEYARLAVARSPPPLREGIDLDLMGFEVDDPVGGDARRTIDVGHLAIFRKARLRHFDNQREVGRSGMAIGVVLGLAPRQRDVRFRLVVVRYPHRRFDHDAPVGPRNEPDEFVAEKFAGDDMGQFLGHFGHQVSVDEHKVIVLGESVRIDHRLILVDG